MRAVMLSGPGPVSNLSVVEVPTPSPPPGWVRIRVRAFGLNRSELHTRLGLAEGVVFPRVPGIEATGVVDDPGDSSFAVGQQVTTMMGGMGRTFDGGYAEYTVVPAAQVIPFVSELPWPAIGAVPETLQTAYGSLVTALDLRPGQTLLIRGGTSSVGLAAAALARDLGATVLSTTRSPGRLAALTAVGVTHPLVDDGSVAAQVRALFPDGVDAALELVGTPTLPDTLAATRVRGTVCFTGMLSNEWLVRDFYPIGYLPTGVRLTAYGGEASDLPPAVLQRFLDRIAAGEVTLGPVHTYAMDDIRTAHTDLERGTHIGKLVGLA
ncbi:zinc-binding dehydrogenase [Dactylosporangium sp. NPDC006015]|uniref:alcohol dehydrogenase catalytic domain-containing protein n=1 Tax=Dactylosporangium sp. NPDC006015 TaxID=3154576 RepID=UPI0033B3E842